MRTDISKLLRILCASGACTFCAVASAAASIADVCKVTMRDGEHWWGVCNSFGTNMPFTTETRDFKADLFAWNYGGQPASLLLSDQGRVVWCAEQTRVSIDGGVIPPGSWIADDGSIVIGPKTISVGTPLGRLPYFKIQNKSRR